MNKKGALLVLALAGCSTIDYNAPPPADWPALEITEVRGDVLYRCPIGALACANIRFDLGTCEVNLPEWAPAWMIKHEYAHCRGFDHEQVTSLADAWQGWKTYGHVDGAVVMAQQ